MQEGQQEQFNLEQMLTATEFTIPVTIEEPSANGAKPIKRKLMVTYEFDDEISKKFSGNKDEAEMPVISEEDLDAVDAILKKDDLSESEMSDLKEQCAILNSAARILLFGKKRLTMDQQLALIIRNIDGVDTQPTEEWWSKVRFKYRTAILEQVLADVYPNAKLSMR